MQTRNKSLVDTKIISAAFLILTLLFTFVTPIHNAMSLPGPHPPIVSFDLPNYDLDNDFPFITVDDPAANIDSGAVETVQVTLSSTSDPVGITLVLTETGVDDHIFTHPGFIFANGTAGTLGSDSTISITDSTLNTNPATKQTVNVHIRSFDPVAFAVRGDIAAYALEETGINTGVFTRTINFATITDAAQNKLETVAGDIIIVENSANGEGLQYLISPNPNSGVGALSAAIGDTITVSYPGAPDDTATIVDVSAPRPILSPVQLRNGGNGGMDRSPPSFTLSKSSIIGLSLPENVVNTVLEADPFTPLTPITTPLIDLPFSINGKGFFLSQYANTIETQTVKTGESIQIKLILQDESGIEHVGLYTNINGSSGEIQNSDTYLIYDEGKPVEITDPQGLFYNVTLTSSEKELKEEFLYNITFAKPMPTSDIILRLWDGKRNSEDIKIFDAINVVGKPIIDPNVAKFDLIKSTQIIIPYYKFPQYAISTADSDGNLIYYNSFGGMEQKQVHPFHASFLYPDTVGKLYRNDMARLSATISDEQNKAINIMTSKFGLNVSQNFVPNAESKPYDELRRANELSLCNNIIGCGLDRENKELMQKLLLEEYLKAETHKSLIYYDPHID